MASNGNGMSKFTIKVPCNQCRKYDMPGLKWHYGNVVRCEVCRCVDGIIRFNMGSAYCAKYLQGPVNASSLYWNTPIRVNDKFPHFTLEELYMVAELEVEGISSGINLPGIHNYTRGESRHLPYVYQPMPRH